jgi:DHA2 family multidrug resistance protein-like MFS transporter
MRPAVTAALAISLLDFFVGFGVLVLTAQYLQLVLGLTPLQAGLWSIPAGVGSAAGSLLTSPMLKLMRPAYVLGLGLTLGASGLIAMAYAAGVHSLEIVIAGSVLLSVSTAPGTAIVADLVVSAAPPERSGAASALSETVWEFGGALGIALLGSLATFLYRSALSQTMPAGISAGVMETALRGIGAAEGLTQSNGGTAALLFVAKTAYTDAVFATFLTGGAILLLAAGIALVTFRKPKKRG